MSVVVELYFRASDMKTLANATGMNYIMVKAQTVDTLASSTPPPLLITAASYDATGNIIGVPLDGCPTPCHP